MTAGADRFGPRWWSWQCVPTKYALSDAGRIHVEGCQHYGTARALRLSDLVEALVDDAVPCRSCGASPTTWLRNISRATTDAYEQVEAMCRVELQETGQ